MTDTSRIAAEGLSLEIELRGGILSNLEIAHAGRTVRPLHRAPWVDEEEATRLVNAPVHLRRLAGDFFCAPFGQSEDMPPHGWAANGHWLERTRRSSPGGGLEVVFDLQEEVGGAYLEKRIALMPGHPFVYQTHAFHGGEGQLPVSHHAMIRVPGGARLSFSRKAMGATPVNALDDGSGTARSLLVYPQRFESLASVELVGGRHEDLRTYPKLREHEDFMTLYDVPDDTIGWSAAVAAADGFIFVSLKDSLLLPQTSLWMSNGGRWSAPWSGRHTDVLGIEEGCTSFAFEASALEAAGFASGLTLDPVKPVAVRYALGAIPAIPGFTEVADIVFGEDHLELQDVSGAKVALPFDVQFFTRG